jgi:ATP-dependent Lon protease
MINNNEIEQYPLIPLRDILVYPGITKPIIVGRPKSYQALDVANSTDKLLFLTLQKDSQNDDPGLAELHEVGVVVEIRQYSKLPDGTVKALVAGLRTAKLKAVTETDNCKYASVENREDVPLTDNETIVFKPVLAKALDEYCKSTSKLSIDLINTVMEAGDINALLYTVADAVSMPDTNTTAIEKRQEVIAKTTVEERLLYVVELMQTELEILKLDEKIRQRVKHQMAKSNREYHLNEQMKAIQKEMGKDDDFKADLDEIEQKIKDMPLPEAVRDKAEREMRKMKLMPPMSAEATVVRNYLDWIVSLPWGERTDDNLDMRHAEEVLNRDHFGLEKPKERIFEYLAVRKLTRTTKGPIICFVGPPGVGKTSLAKSIAEAMGRNFVRMSMGGMRDEAEIRGHRRTYIGSMPGRIIQSARKAASLNPVFLLDEIDKLGADYRGDPAAALLEALDPEQNKHFVDHYMEIDFDLSSVFFITTANTLEPIPSALLDRMEVIRLPGYTEEEKFHIARKYLIPKQLKEHGFDENTGYTIDIADDAIYALIKRYTNEVGVRNLEREIASLIRKAARRLTQDESTTAITVTGEEVASYLGEPRSTGIGFSFHTPTSNNTGESSVLRGL